MPLSFFLIPGMPEAVFMARQGKISDNAKKPLTDRKRYDTITPVNILIP